MNSSGKRISSFRQRLSLFIKNDFWILLLDIVAVNLSYFIALYLRFFVNGEFRDSVSFYQEFFWHAVPFYTIVAIVVFVLFRLYGNMWKYAGLNDINRIIGANAVTAVLYVLVSILSIALLPSEEQYTRWRMPLTYYVLGALIQFVFIVLIRLFPGFLLKERQKIARGKTENIPVLIVGTGDYAQKVIRHLDENTPFRPAAIAGTGNGLNMNGIPVISRHEIKEQIKTNGIKAVFIADDALTEAQLKEIKEASAGVELRDYTGYLSNLSGPLPVSSILEVAEGPVTLVINGKEQTFGSANEALGTLKQRYEIKRIIMPRIELEIDHTDESWIKKYQEETGEDVSFF